MAASNSKLRTHAMRFIHTPYRSPGGNREAVTVLIAAR